eukprot:762004-Hanusia_phi.AAC.1
MGLGRGKTHHGKSGGHNLLILNLCYHPRISCSAIERKQTNRDSPRLPVAPRHVDTGRHCTAARAAPGSSQAEV